MHLNLFDRSILLLNAVYNGEPERIGRAIVLTTQEIAERNLEQADLLCHLKFFSLCNDLLEKLTETVVRKFSRGGEGHVFEVRDLPTRWVTTSDQVQDVTLLSLAVNLDPLRGISHIRKHEQQSWFSSILG